MTKLPETASIRAPYIGELAKPMLNKASTSKRIDPTASNTQRKDSRVVTRKPL